MGYTSNVVNVAAVNNSCCKVKCSHMSCGDGEFAQVHQVSDECDEGCRTGVQTEKTYEVGMSHDDTVAPHCMNVQSCTSEDTSSCVGAFHKTAGGMCPPDCVETCDATVHSKSAANLLDDASVSCAANILCCGTGLMSAMKTQSHVSMYGTFPSVVRQVRAVEEGSSMVKACNVSGQPMSATECVCVKGGESVCAAELTTDDVGSTLVSEVEYIAEVDGCTENT